MKLRCDNCDATYAAEEELACVFPDIADLLARIEPGGSVPHGECPQCHCLVYEVPDDLQTGERPDDEWHLSAYRCRVCGDLVVGIQYRDHLESHNPNAAGLDWDEVQAQFTGTDDDEQPADAEPAPA
jgi:hypothetical protein